MNAKGIYRISGQHTNPRTGDCYHLHYWGSTTSFDLRAAQHRQKLEADKHYNKVLSNWYKNSTLTFVPVLELPTWDNNGFERVVQAVEQVFIEYGQQTTFDTTRSPIKAPKNQSDYYGRQNNSKCISANRIQAVANDPDQELYFLVNSYRHYLRDSGQLNHRLDVALDKTLAYLDHIHWNN
ncbi:hypothetical protein [Vibrio fluvialis]|uniref:hypothetical protein n=1 Tax=Vibrio fluvialis TaxID=676 RepID=UPI001BAF3193|nr:hypothetical protein [Vibrio fluvialis]QUF70050.1 hypothetical protein KC397_06560 [Vibrio fluvialis]